MTVLPAIVLHGQRRICQMTLLAFIGQHQFLGRCNKLTLPLEQRRQHSMNLRDLGIPGMPHNELLAVEIASFSPGSDQLGVNQFQHDLRMPNVIWVGHDESLGRLNQRKRSTVLVSQVR